LTIIPEKSLTFFGDSPKILEVKMKHICLLAVGFLLYSNFALAKSITIEASKLEVTTQPLVQQINPDQEAFAAMLDYELNRLGFGKVNAESPSPRRDPDCSNSCTTKTDYSFVTVNGKECKRYKTTKYCDYYSIDPKTQRCVYRGYRDTVIKTWTQC
jgi:hypothetical protein